MKLSSNMLVKLKWLLRNIWKQKQEAKNNFKAKLHVKQITTKKPYL